MVKNAYKFTSGEIVMFLLAHNKSTKIKNPQWYISENVNEKGIPLKNQHYTSISLDINRLVKLNYINKYIYLEFLEEELDIYIVKKTEYIKLDYIDNMIRNGIVFDHISTNDKKGNLVDIKEFVENRIYNSFPG